CRPHQNMKKRANARKETTATRTRMQCTETDNHHRSSSNKRLKINPHASVSIRQWTF
ncbi:unnamed protein product, partial [Aphanomyces euteiches]